MKEDCTCLIEEGVLSVEQVQKISFLQTGSRSNREKIQDLLTVCQINISQNSDLILDQLFSLYNKTFYPLSIILSPEIKFKIYYGFSNYWKADGEKYGYDFRDLYLLFSFTNQEYLYAKSQTLLNGNFDMCKLNKMSFYEWRNYCSTANIFFPISLGSIDRIANRLY